MLLRQWEAPLDVEPPIFFCSAWGQKVDIATYQQQRKLGCWWPPPVEDLPERMTIVRTGGLGDILFMRPAIRSLKKTRPDITVNVLTDWPEVANGDTNSRYALFAPDEVLLILDEWVERHPRRYIEHRSNLFARGMGLHSCDSCAFDGEIGPFGKPLVEKPYVVVQYGGASLWRCPTTEWMNRLVKALPFVTVAVSTNATEATTTYNPTPCSRHEFLALVSHASLVIAGDSGPFHLARACGVPCIGLYGPIPAALRVRDAAETCRVVESDLPVRRGCGPCQENGPCGKLGAAECLDAIPIDTVVDIARELMEGR